LTTKFSTIDESKAWIEAVTNRPHSLIYSISFHQPLSSAETASIIGIIGLNSFDRLIYMLHPDFWGAGYTTEALRCLLKHLFKSQPERDLVVAGVHDGNERSLRVLLKCGFVVADSLEDAGTRGGLHKQREEEGNAKKMAAEADDQHVSATTDIYAKFSWLRLERGEMYEM
jgi:RimJ/RimL family protein N-acetyltransferase